MSEIAGTQPEDYGYREDLLIADNVTPEAVRRWAESGVNMRTPDEVVGYKSDSLQDAGAPDDEPNF